MKKLLEEKNSLIIIFTFLVLLCVTIFFIIFYNILTNNQQKYVDINYKIFVTEVESKLEGKYYDIVYETFDREKILEIEVDPNNLLIDQSEIKDIQLNSLNNIFKNSNDNNLKIIIHYNNKLYIDDSISLYNDTLGTYYFLTEDKASVFSASGNRFIPLIDINIFNNINQVNQYNISINKNEVLTVKYNNNYNIYMVQLSQKPLVDEIMLFKYATFISLAIFSAIVIYIIISKNKFTDKSIRLEEFLSSYENIYYILVNSKGEVIKTNQLTKQNFSDQEVLQVIETFKNNINDYEISIQLNNKVYLFKKLVYHDSLLLLSENYTEKIMEQNKIIYNNKLSNLPNYNSLEKYINNSNSKQKSSLILFSIKNIKSIIASNNITNAKLISTIKNNFNKSIDKDDRLLFHLKSDLFSILIKNDHVLEEQTKSIDEKLIKLKSDLLKETNISFEFIVGIINIDQSVLIENISLKNIINAVLNVAYKYNGNKIVFYDNQLKKELVASETIKSDLEKGIENKEFIMYLQPIYNLETNKVVKYEALLRWNNEKYINTSPLTYIKIAEEYELIYELGYLIIEESTKLAAKIKDKDISVTINVSPKELGNLGFADKLLSEIKKNNISPNKIGIEITETSLIEATSYTLENINKIRSKGICIYLDDFGTGYSSLINLRDFPVDYIKIDRIFVNNMVSNIIDEKITASLIDLSHSLNLKVIAEGVECEEQSEKLKQMGCKLIQGYYYSKPLLFEELFKNN